MATTNNNTEYKPDCDPVHIARRMKRIQDGMGIAPTDSYAGVAITNLPRYTMLPWEICTRPNKAFYFVNDDGLSGYLVWVQYDLMQMIAKTGKTCSGDLNINQWLYLVGTRTSIPTGCWCPYMILKTTNGFAYEGETNYNNVLTLLDKDFFYIEGLPFNTINGVSGAVPINGPYFVMYQMRWLTGSEGLNQTDSFYVPNRAVGGVRVNYMADSDQYQFSYISRSSSTTPKNIDLSSNRNTKALFLPKTIFTGNFSTAYPSGDFVLTQDVNDPNREASQYNIAAYGARSLNSGNPINLKTNIYETGNPYQDLTRVGRQFDSRIARRVHPYILANY